MNKFRHIALAVALAGAIGINVAGATNASGPDRSLHLTGQQRHLIRSLTKQYRDADAAVAAGYMPTDECVAVPGIGGMGYHYVHPDHIADGVVDVAKPDVLVYHDGPNGKLRLGAVEYLEFDTDQDLTTDDDRPYLFGQYPFDGPMEGHGPEMPRHYDLHVWLYRDNPNGELSAFNPRVSCLHSH